MRQHTSSSAKVCCRTLFLQCSTSSGMLLHINRGRVGVDDGIFYQRVVGVSHHQEALEGCRPGQPVRLIHEPDNPHDEMALKVETADGKAIGYLPRRSWIHKAIHEQGRGVSAVISSVGYGRACLLGCVISVALCDDEVETRSYYPNLPPPEPPRGGFRYWVSTPASAARLVKERTGLASPTRAQHPRYQPRSKSEASKSQGATHAPRA